MWSTVCFSVCSLEALRLVVVLAVLDGDSRRQVVLEGLAAIVGATKEVERVAVVRGEILNRQNLGL